ncbi:hypothetical protein DMX06_13965 [Pseudomonas mosselii]|nr:hypothetical protein DMX06_13965 [Pseudomonas mosselii]
MRPVSKPPSKPGWPNSASRGLSRVNPLPQGLHSVQGLCRSCGSGFTRECDGTAHEKIRLCRTPLRPYIPAGRRTR